jgi:peptide/nickel transport system permease protein
VTRCTTSANGGWLPSDLRLPAPAFRSGLAAPQVARFLFQRVALGALVIVFASALTFFFVNLAPGGPASVMRFDVTAEQREALIKRMGLDRPVTQRYVEWVGGAVRGDLGTSLLTDEPVTQRIGERLPNTITLAGAALTLSVALGIPIGLIQALRRGSPLDHLLSLLSAIGLSVPVFWLGIVLILLFAVTLRVLPSAGVTGVAEDTLVVRLRHLVLPMVVLATTVLPTVVRFMRSAALEVLHEDYIRTATSKGLAPRVVIGRHALRNALIPVVSAIGALVPRLLGGTVVTESVFSWPGLGRLALEAAEGRDYPLITGLTVVVAAIAVATTLLVDLLYTRIDPRIRLA